MPSLLDVALSNLSIRSSNEKYIRITPSDSTNFSAFERSDRTLIYLYKNAMMAIDPQRPDSVNHTNFSKFLEKEQLDGLIKYHVMNSSFPQNSLQKSPDVSLHILLPITYSGYNKEKLGGQYITFNVLLDIKVQSGKLFYTIYSPYSYSPDDGFQVLKDSFEKSLNYSFGTTEKKVDKKSIHQDEIKHSQFNIELLKNNEYEAVKRTEIWLMIYAAKVIQNDGKSLSDDGKTFLSYKADKLFYVEEHANNKKDINLDEKKKKFDREGGGGGSAITTSKAEPDCWKNPWSVTDPKVLNNAATSVNSNQKSDVKSDSKLDSKPDSSSDKQVTPTNKTSNLPDSKPSNEKNLRDKSLDQNEQSSNSLIKNKLEKLNSQTGIKKEEVIKGITSNGDLLTDINNHMHHLLGKISSNPNGIKYSLWASKYNALLGVKNLIANSRANETVLRNEFEIPSQDIQIEEIGVNVVSLNEIQSNNITQNDRKLVDELKKNANQFPLANIGVKTGGFFKSRTGNLLKRAEEYAVKRLNRK